MIFVSLMNLQDMIEAGVDSFKIDGILKAPEYILTVTKLYRQAIDTCVEDPDAYEDIKDELLEKIEEIQPANRPLDTGSSSKKQFINRKCMRYKGGL